MYINKHCEVLVSCSGQQIQKDSKMNKQEPSGTFKNLQEPSATVTACKLLQLLASYCNCLQATVTACKLL